MGIVALPHHILVAAALGTAGLMLIAFSLGMLVEQGRAARGGSAVDGVSTHGSLRSRRRRVVKRGGSVPGEGDEAITDATRRVEAAAEPVIRDLERRSAAAAELLDEAEAKIARLKEMLAACEAARAPRDQADGTGMEADMRLPEKHSLVFDMADRGLSVPEIAKRAGIGRGEAQLILDLRARGEAPGTDPV